MPKLCPMIILEGIHPTYKTEITFVLNEHPHIVRPFTYRCHSPIISTERNRFTPIRWVRGLINFETQQEEQERTVTSIDWKSVYTPQASTWSFARGRLDPLPPSAPSSPRSRENQVSMTICCTLSTNRN